VVTGLTLAECPPGTPPNGIMGKRQPPESPLSGGSPVQSRFIMTDEEKTDHAVALNKDSFEFLEAGNLARLRVIHQDAAHHARGQAQHLVPAGPIQVMRPQQAQVFFVHQGSRLQGVIGPLAGQARLRKAVQLGVKRRHRGVQHRLVARAKAGKRSFEIGRPSHPFY